VDAIDGLQCVPLEPHADDRGVLVEVFSTNWNLQLAPAQWNTVRSRAGSLRGVHCHLRHTDVVVVTAGEMLLGLHDARPSSSTSGASTTMRLVALEHAVVIPRGVAHGFYFPIESVCLVGVSDTWDPDDELRCRFDDEGLGLQWPTSTPILSTADANAGTLTELRDAVRASFARPES